MLGFLLGGFMVDKYLTLAGTLNKNAFKGFIAFLYNDIKLMSIRDGQQWVKSEALFFSGMANVLSNNLSEHIFFMWRTNRLEIYMEYT